MTELLVKCDRPAANSGRSKTLGRSPELSGERPPSVTGSPGRLQHLYQRTQRGGHLPVTRMVEIKSLDHRRPFLQHADQLARAQERTRIAFGDVRQPQSIGCRTQGELA